MLNLRMLGLASALFLILPAWALADPCPSPDDCDAAEWGAEASAWISDVVLYEMQANKTYDPESFYAEEQLVEGHTVFATIDLRANVTPPDEGNVTVTGEVHCKEDLRYEGPTYQIGPFNVVVPRRIDRVGAECRVGNDIYICPTVYDSRSSEPQFTGQFVPFTSPTGEQAYAREFTFTALVVDEHGYERERTFYGWTTPVLRPFAGPDGEPKNFLMPLPVEQLRHNDVQDYRALLPEEAR